MKKILLLLTCIVFTCLPSLAGIPGAQYSTTAGVFSIGTLPINCGGLGLSGTPSDGQIPIGNSSGYTLHTLTPGTGISISNGSGTITIDSTVTGGLTINPIPYTAATVSLTGSEDNYLVFDVTSNVISVNLPAASTQQGLVYWLTSLDTSSTHHAVTIIAHGSDGILRGYGGLISSFSFKSNDGPIGLISDGVSSWYLFTPGFLTGASATSLGIMIVDSNGEAGITSAPLGLSFGGTGQVSFTSHGVLIGNNTAGLNVTAAGTAGYPLVANSSADPTFQQLTATGIANATITGTQIASSVALAGSPTTTTQSSSDNSTKIATTAYVQSVLPAPAYGFGGNGATGAVSITSTGATTAPFQENATTFSVTGSTVLTVGTANTPTSPWIVNCTSTFTLGDGTNASTITIAAGSGAAGGQPGYFSGASNGPPGGRGSGLGGGGGGQIGYWSSNASGGEGGSFGAKGGGGGGNGSSNGYTGGTTPYSAFILGGSGGGGGAGASSASASNGGNSGGSLIVCAVGAINCEAVSVINCLGSNGVAAVTQGGGGGGGSGGLVFLASQTSVTVAGTINVSGGNGAAGAGTAGGGGGGGGSGRIICWSPSNSTGSATFTMGGGSAGGAGGTGAAGAAGSSGTEQSITGTPNLPLLTWLQTPEGSNTFTLFGQLGINNINQRTLANFAGHNAIQEFAHYNMGNFQESTCLGVGDFNKDMLNYS